MKLLKLSITKTRSTGDQVTAQKNGRVRISVSLAEKLDFKIGDEVDIFTDQEDRTHIYVTKGSTYKLFKHVKGSNSGIYFGSAQMFKEIGIEDLTLHNLPSKLMKFKDVLYLQLDVSEILPKILKPLEAEKKEEEKPVVNGSNNRNRNKPKEEEQPTFL